MRHRYAHYVVGGGDYLPWQTVAFCSHDDGKAVDGLQHRMVEGDGVVRQCHGGCLESLFGKRRYGRVEPRPRHQEDTAHRHAYRTAVEGVARVGCEQDGVNAECCCRTEYGSNVCGVAYSIYHHHTVCILAYLLHRGQQRTIHSAEHATGECIASEL